MELEQMKTKIDQVSILLYQNKEHEAIDEINELLVAIQEIIANTITLDEQVSLFAINAMRELLEAYQNADMLCMADCLQGKILLWIEMLEMIEKEA